MLGVTLGTTLQLLSLIGERKSAGMGRIPDGAGSNLESACSEWMIPPGLLLWEHHLIRHSLNGLSDCQRHGPPCSVFLICTGVTETRGLWGGCLMQEMVTLTHIIRNRTSLDTLIIFDFYYLYLEIQYGIEHKN